MKLFDKRFLFPLFICIIIFFSSLNTSNLGKALFLPNKVDEFSYLDQIRFSALEKSNAAFYKEYSNKIPLLENLTQNVSSIVDYTVGKTLYMFHPYTAGLILDILCIIISFYLLTFILDIFTNERFISNIAAFIGITIPKFIPFDDYGLFPEELTTHILNSSISKHIGCTAIRGVYTQIAFIFFFLAFYFYLNAIVKKVNIKIYFSAVITGFLLNIYFFAWLSLMTILNLLNLFYIFNHLRRKNKFSLPIKSFFIFTIISIACSLPGIIMIKSLNATLKTPCNKIISNYWYFAPELLITLLIILSSIYIINKSSDKLNLKNLSLLSYLFISVILAPLFIMNLQPLSGCFLSPFRSMCYILPIFASLASLLILSYLKKFNIKLLLVSFILILFLASYKLTLPSYNIIREINNIPAKKDLVEFIDYVNNNLKEKSFAIWPGYFFIDKQLPKFFAIRLFPTAFRSLTESYLLSQSWIFPGRVSLAEMTEREALLNWVFTGKIKDLYLPCKLIKDKSDLPGDLLEFTWSAHFIFRDAMCDYIDNNKISSCELLKKYHFDYVLNNINVVLPNQDYLELIWTSKFKKYKLYKFKKDLALRSECKP